MEKEKSSLGFIQRAKQKGLVHFIVIVLILASYFVVISLKYGLKDGILATLITWSFFVFCTPIADAGFLVDFPVRMVTDMRMIQSEMLVWFAALLLNAFAFLFHPTIYDRTGLLAVFRHIITNPYPYWGIVILSAIGTFVSIHFGDHVVDAVKHIPHKKYSKKIMIMFAILIVLTILLYIDLLRGVGISISLL